MTRRVDSATVLGSVANQCSTKMESSFWKFWAIPSLIFLPYFVNLNIISKFWLLMSPNCTWLWALAQLHLTVLPASVPSQEKLFLETLELFLPCVLFFFSRLSVSNQFLNSEFCWWTQLHLAVLPAECYTKNRQLFLANFLTYTIHPSWFFFFRLLLSLLSSKPVVLILRSCNGQLW